MFSRKYVPSAAATPIACSPISVVSPKLSATIIAMQTYPCFTLTLPDAIGRLRFTG